MKILKFGAAWCSPCKNLVSLMYDTFGDDERVQKMVSYDMDKDFELAKKYNVRSIPTLILLDDKGDVLRTLTTNRTVDGIRKFLTGE